MNFLNWGIDMGAKLELSNTGIEIDVPDGKSILQATLDKGINHAHACGGNGLCSTCRVYIEEGLSNVSPKNEVENSLSNALGLGPEIRLACQTTLTGNARVRRLVLDEIDQDIILNHGAQGAPRSLGTEKMASVLFVDIADYTAFTESTLAYDVVHILNRYFYIAGSIIKEHNGRIIDYYGDGFLAIFGLDDDTEHAENVIKAGFNLQKAIDQFDHDVHDITNSDFKIRLGAHTGKVIWGTIGIEGMEKEAAIGDTVNFASRIEQANKDLNTIFLISEALYNEVREGCEILQEHEISVKGKTGKYKVYALNCTIS